MALYQSSFCATKVFSPFDPLFNSYSYDPMDGGRPRGLKRKSAGEDESGGSKRAHLEGVTDGIGSLSFSLPEEPIDLDVTQPSSPEHKTDGSESGRSDAGTSGLIIEELDPETEDSKHEESNAEVTEPQVEEPKESEDVQFNINECFRDILQPGSSRLLLPSIPTCTAVVVYNPSSCRIVDVSSERSDDEATASGGNVTFPDDEPTETGASTSSEGAAGQRTRQAPEVVITSPSNSAGSSGDDGQPGMEVDVEASNQEEEPMDLD